ncbi:MAG: hypothetical protein GXO87_14490 [Chlorobi bacterium]|nr:hypothetical protein [Chlorobiota bacterium]
MLNKYLHKKFSFIWLTVLIAAAGGCIQDRMAPVPEPVARPDFITFDTSVSKLAVPLNQALSITFNSKMDLSTFNDNLIVESVSGKVEQSFSYSPSADTVVVFTPKTNYNKAEIYDVALHGGARNVYGMSMISPTEEDVPKTDWFFTAGDYSENGFPYVFVRDKTAKQVIYRVGEIDKYIDSLYVEATNEDYQTAALEFTPDGNYLLMVNLKTTDGTVTVIDPESFQNVKTITVGLGPTNVGFGENDLAYVVNTSGKSFTAINLNTLEAAETVGFSDGFKPKDVVYSSLTGKLYFYSSSKKEIKVVNASDFEDSHILSDVLPDAKAVDIEISKDGKYIFLPESRTEKVVVLDAETEEIVTVIESGYPYVSDGVVSDNYYYLSFFKNVDGDNIGGVIKIDIPSFEFKEIKVWEYEIDKVGLTNSDELLYTVVPSDSTVKILEAKTLRTISETKLPGSLKYIAVSKNNYR